MRKMKKLRLGRDTLRLLEPVALGEAAGGTYATFSCACNTSPAFTSGCVTQGGTNNSCHMTACVLN